MRNIACVLLFIFLFMTTVTLAQEIQIHEKMITISPLSLDAFKKGNIEIKVNETSYKVVTCKEVTQPGWDYAYTCKIEGKEDIWVYYDGFHDTGGSLVIADIEEITEDNVSVKFIQDGDITSSYYKSKNDGEWYRTMQRLYLIKEKRK